VSLSLVKKLTVTSAEDEDEDVKLDFFKCEIGFFHICNWTISNVKLRLFLCKTGFVPT
jgi:hypothetical protein